jgi:hypothetical protein
MLEEIHRLHFYYSNRDRIHDIGKTEPPITEALILTAISPNPDDMNGAVSGSH